MREALVSCRPAQHGWVLHAGSPSYWLLSLSPWGRCDCGGGSYGPSGGANGTLAVAGRTGDVGWSEGIPLRSWWAVP